MDKMEKKEREGMGGEKEGGDRRVGEVGAEGRRNNRKETRREKEVDRRKKTRRGERRTKERGKAGKIGVGRSIYIGSVYMQISSSL